MNYWRMAFRYGVQGVYLWDHCFNMGIAAIGEFDNFDRPLPDLRTLSEGEYKAFWKTDSSVTGRISITNFYYKMALGDVIYVKGPSSIIGCGIVISHYQFDPKIMAGTKSKWNHFVRVSWDQDFQPIKILLGAEIITCLQLKEERLSLLESVLEKSGQRLRKPTDEHYQSVMGSVAR